MAQLAIEVGAQTIEAAKTFNIKGVPIHAQQFIKDGITSVKANLEKNNLQVCQIGAFEFNALADEKTNNHHILKEAICNAQEFNCKHIVIHGGSYASPFAGFNIKNHHPDTINKVADSLSPFINLAEKNNVKIAVEIHLKNAIHNASSFLLLQRTLQSSALVANIDITSLYTFSNIYNHEALIEETCSKLAGHYGLIHIKEVNLEDGFHIHMGLTPLSKGKTNWTKKLQAIAPHINEHTWIMLEHITDLNEAKESLDIFYKHAKDANITLL